MNFIERINHDFKPRRTLASYICKNNLKLTKPTIREAFSDFQGIEHRLEPVINIGGVEYWNDSEATNINKTWLALQQFPNHKDPNIIWLAGGIDKGNDYKKLIPSIKGKVKAIITLVWMILN